MYGLARLEWESVRETEQSEWIERVTNGLATSLAASSCNFRRALTATETLLVLSCGQSSLISARDRSKAFAGAEQRTTSTRPWTDPRRADSLLLPCPREPRLQSRHWPGPVTEMAISAAVKGSWLAGLA